MAVNINVSSLGLPGVSGSTPVIASALNVVLFEDFLASTTAGNMGWTVVSANSGTTSIIDSESNHSGIARLSTNTFSASGYANLHLGTNTVYLGNGTLTLEFLIRLPTLSTSAERYAARIGLGDTSTGSHSNGIFFEYDESTSPNWIICTNNNTTPTKTTSSTAVSANTWIRLKIVVNAGASSVEYFVDGTSIGTITTTIPTVSGVRMHIIKSVGTSARTIDIDFVNLQYVLTTER